MWLIVYIKSGYMGMRVGFLDLKIINVQRIRRGLAEMQGFVEKKMKWTEKKDLSRLNQDWRDYNNSRLV